MAQTVVERDRERENPQLLHKYLTDATSTALIFFVRVSYQRHIRRDTEMEGQTERWKSIQMLN